MADIPGLVPGAHLNKGLGHYFLKHVQRCSMLVIVLDASASHTNMVTQLGHLQNELRLFDENLLHSASLIVANKMDTCEELGDTGTQHAKGGVAFERDLRRVQEESGLSVIPISALKLWNIHPLKEALFRIAKLLKKS